MTDLYRRLQIDPAACVEVVNAAYKTLAKLLHPDVAGSDTTRDMALLNAAYDVLRDPIGRARYDRDRQVGQQTSTPEPKPVYMGYGRYKGQPITAVPTDYLLWVIHNIEKEGHVFDASQELVRRGRKTA